MAMAVTPAAAVEAPDPEGGSAALRWCLKFRRKARTTGQRLLSKKVPWIVQSLRDERERAGSSRDAAPLCHQHRLIVGCLWLWYEELRREEEGLPRLRASAAIPDELGGVTEDSSWKSCSSDGSPVAADLVPFLQQALAQLGAAASDGHTSLVDGSDAASCCLTEATLSELAECVLYWERMYDCVNEKLLGEKPLTHALKLLAAQPREGLWLEFGVAGGGSLCEIAEVARQIGPPGTLGRPSRVYGFDSFDGLPEDWRHGIGTGAFASGGKPPDVLGKYAEDVELVLGLFGDTLESFLQQQPANEPVALVHIDCDLYSSTVARQMGGSQQALPTICHGSAPVAAAPSGGEPAGV
eukprot:TRINITY_DN18120_c0_g1_i2.p1 TRINITY_DN18120_c0_g1~~TRINITY_DN18120_c0_g1_i2.p1  ORF type:complete len:354 (-),score=86.33 TRINITY_DN18120_c0_g1_i2:150-1211(-)